MNEKYGIILLDGDEITVRIYEKDTNNAWQLLHYQNYDFTPFTKRSPLGSTEIVETIARMSLSHDAAHVSEWLLAARNISEELIQEVSSATSIKAELLTLNREQELLCNGLLLELQ